MTLVTFGLIIIIGGAALFAYYASTAPDLDEELLKDPLTSNFLTKDGDIFLKFGVEKRDYVPYDEIPEQMKNAILATEDVRFFEHGGVDFYRLGGAVVANIRNGFGSQGGSTLTQQVIKNSFLKNEKTLKRKAQEAWLAYKLEKEYRKEEIFEMYFNKVLISGNRYGFGTGASFFYGKTLNELNLAEMAMLAGMPQYPNGYNPFKYPERAENRRNVVLTLMQRHGKITNAEMESAKQVSVVSTLLAEDERETFTKYPAYVDAVLDELEDSGYYDLLAEGVTVQTALDPKAQEIVEAAINDSRYYESEEMQAGMTVLDTKKGTIVAIGGGREYSGRNLNFAKMKRQPGSVIKPILSYGPAIEEFDWSTGQKVVDEPYKYKGTNKSINNADGRFEGVMTMREALYKSRNIPAVKTFELVGGKKAKSFAANLGLTYTDINSGHALGGDNAEFSTIDMAGAYAAFGNGGMYTKPHAVTKITLRDGKTEKNLRPDPVSAMKDSTAYMITDVLRDVLTDGTAKIASIRGLDIAGKTGTTNYSAATMKERKMKSTDVPDTWFTGYTPEYTISTWGGYADYKTPITTYDYGRYVPQKLFKTVMTSIASSQEKFIQPASVEEAAIVRGSDPIVLASSFSSSYSVRNELFVRGTLPKKQAIPDKITIPSPSNLTAKFDASSNSITLNWNYDIPKKYNSLGTPSFNVSVSIDGGASQSVSKTTGQQAVFSAAEFGKSYTFSVSATMGGYSSGYATTTLSLAGSSQPEIEEPDEEAPTIDEVDPNVVPEKPTDEEKPDIEEPNKPAPDNPNGPGQEDQSIPTNPGQDNQGNQNTPNIPGQGQGNEGTGDQGTGDQGNSNNQGTSNIPTTEIPIPESN